MTCGGNTKGPGEGTFHARFTERLCMQTDPLQGRSHWKAGSKPRQPLVCVHRTRFTGRSARLGPRGWSAYTALDRRSAECSVHSPVGLGVLTSSYTLTLGAPDTRSPTSSLWTSLSWTCCIHGIPRRVTCVSGVSHRASRVQDLSSFVFCGQVAVHCVHGPRCLSSHASMDV